MLAHLKKWNRWFLHPSLYPDLDVEKREIREFIMALSFFVLVLYLSKVQNQVTCCYAFMLPVSCPTNAIVYKASGKFLYIPCINILKRYCLEMFFCLFGKVKWDIWILENSYVVKCLQMIFFAGMKSWQMLTAGIGMNIATLVVKSSPRSSISHVVQTFYHLYVD